VHGQAWGDTTSDTKHPMSFAVSSGRTVNPITEEDLPVHSVTYSSADQDASLNDLELEFAALWNALPKVVFSTTLSAVHGNARLASVGLAEEIERLRAEPGVGDIAIGGAALAAQAASLGLIDEYRVRVYPVLVGGGTPFFAQRGRRVGLELVETRVFSSNVVYLRNRVSRS
jgi:riboflavin biosynthesis pyrimidine reductase